MNLNDIRIVQEKKTLAGKTVFLIIEKSLNILKNVSGRSGNPYIQLFIEVSMSISSVMSQGVSGIQQSQREMVKSADQIARAGTINRDAENTMDLVEPLVQMKIQTHVFDASARVVETADKTLGSLLSIKA